MDNECANHYKLLDVMDHLDTKVVNSHLEKDRILNYGECIEIVAGLVKEMQDKGLTNKTE